MRLKKHLEQHAAEEEDQRKGRLLLSRDLRLEIEEAGHASDEAARKLVGKVELDLAALTTRLDALEARSAPVAESVPDVPVAPARKTAGRKTAEKTDG